MWSALQYVHDVHVCLTSLHVYVVCVTVHVHVYIHYQLIIINTCIQTYM